MQIYTHEDMALLKAQRIKTLTQTFDAISPRPSYTVGKAVYKLDIYRAGQSEIRVKAAILTGSAWSGDLSMKERVAKMRIKYHIVEDTDFYNRLVDKIRGALDRMKLDKAHSSMCNDFLKELVHQLQESNISDIKEVSIK